MARTGRRSGSSDTRGGILEAARSEFAEVGYQGATIRGIAAAAGVDPALVHHYFGNKEELFAAAIHFPMAPAQATAMILDGGIDNAGENLARLFVSVWESPESRAPLLAMLRGAFTTQQGADSLREFFETALLARVAPEIPGPDAGLRVGLVASHLIGMAVLRYVVGFEVLRQATAEELVEMITPRLQSYFTG